MKLSIIETKKSGNKVLYVFYKDRDWDVAIGSALRKFGLERGAVTIIAMPSDCKFAEQKK